MKLALGRRSGPGRAWPIGLLCAVWGCEEPAVMNIIHEPRFVHDQADPRPDDRSTRYPDEWEARTLPTLLRTCSRIGVPLAGMDVLLEYLKKDGALDSDERVFQQIRYDRTIRQTRSTCGDQPVSEDWTVVEVFNPDRPWDLVTAHACAEMMIDARITGRAGVVDIDDLPASVRDALPAFRNDENAFILGRRNEDTGNIEVRPGLRIDVSEFREAERETQKSATINWSAHYQFDGCNPQGQRTTNCGPNAIHCTQLRLRDAVKGFARNYSR